MTFVAGLGSSVAPARLAGAKDIRGTPQNVTATMDSNARTRIFAMVYGPLDRSSPASRISTYEDNCLLIGQCPFAAVPPPGTKRIFSSGRKCRRAARGMSLIASSAGCFSDPDFCLIFAPCGYDDPEILPS